jgi:hypothetical protein
VGIARFYVDESLLAIGRALAHARRDVVYPGHPRLPEGKPGDDDETWIPLVAAAGLIAILRDRRVVTRWWENDLVVAHRLRLIHLAVKRDLTSWGYLCLLVKHWNSIERHIADADEGPWRLAVLETRVDLRPIRPSKVTGPRPPPRKR